MEIDGGFILKHLKEKNIPVTSWFVDNPYFFIYRPKFLFPMENLSVFCWEKEYVKMLKNDFKRVYYLPLATDPEIFCPVDVSSLKNNPYNCDISFVGNSNLKFAKRNERWLNDAKMLPVIEYLIHDHLKEPWESWDFNKKNV